MSVPVKKLPRPVTLAEIKADASFKSFPLVRISRLSVMPVSDDEWQRIEALVAGLERAAEAGSVVTRVESGLHGS